ncbi:MAG TPA: hypothetical protein VJ276_12570, partial [Thermoanaerobaculia bacterium]|nr:hypothetical protein [Thermoanaerobaculia bacterium]
MGSINRPNVIINLGRNTELELVLEPSVGLRETLTVTAAAPTIDVNTASVGANLDQRAIETLPTGRNYSSIVQVNFEFIREVEVKTGGYEAEYGRSTGGIINVITKSGGNQLTGDVFGYYDNDSLQSDADTVVSTAGTTEGFTRRDFGLDFGGDLLRDRLWFFGAFDQVRNSISSSLPEGPAVGDVVASNSRCNLGSGKLTWNFGPAQSLVATFMQDPRVDTGAINDSDRTLNGEPSTYLGRKDYAPRLGFTWHPSGGAHRAKLYGSYGRFYEEIPMDLVIRSFSYERQPRTGQPELREAGAAHGADERTGRGEDQLLNGRAGVPPAGGVTSRGAAFPPGETPGGWRTGRPLSYWLPALLWAGM